jgi:hypothetical protein
MNELIRELAIKAGARECGGYITDPVTGNQKWSETGGLSIATPALGVDEFAEYIVQQCLGVVGGMVGSTESNQDAVTLAAAYHAIKKHFKME